MECILYNSFSELPDHYHELFDRNFDNNFYSSCDWFKTLYEATTEAGTQLLIFGVEEQNKALGIMFMTQTRKRQGLFMIKKLSSLTNIYSVTYAPLLNCEEKTELEILQKIIKKIRVHTQKWNIITFRNIDKSSSLFNKLCELLNNSNYSVHTFFCHKNWYEYTKNTDFDTYLSKRKSKMKSNHRRRLKKISNDLGKPEFQLYSKFDNIEYAIKEFNNIYALSWKGQEKHPEFIEKIIRMAAAKNILRLGLYSANGRTLAAKITFATKTCGHMYKTAYDPKYRKYGAGTAINMFMIEHLLNVDKVELLDFGIGNETYKSDFMETSKERWGITAYNKNTIPGYLYGLYYEARQFAKKCYRLLNPPKAN